MVHIRTPDNVVLLGKHNEHKRKTSDLVIILHGWEGSSESNYVVSMGSGLFETGFDTFRLNFRDHGDTHHLNKGIFHSNRLKEMIDAIKHLHRIYPSKQIHLAGFSLGGNFALRLAEKLPFLQSVCAICPVFSPADTMDAFNEAPRFYEQYFVKKWKKSLLKKLSHFPEYGYQRKLKSAKTLDDLNQAFIPPYTHYSSVKDYFNDYTLTPRLLSNIHAPCLVIAAEDDPIIRATHTRKVMAKAPKLIVELQEMGGHCAFLDSYSLTSWADKRAAAFFTVHSTMALEIA